MVSSCRRYFEKQLPIIEEALAKGDFYVVMILDWRISYLSHVWIGLQYIRLNYCKNTSIYLEKIRLRDT